MATRSMIGKLNADGTVTAVCHWGGYTEEPGEGWKLPRFWTDPAKIDQMLVLGDMFVIGAEIGEKHRYDVRNPDTHGDICTFCGRDGGEQGGGPRTYASEGAYWEIQDVYEADYLYLFRDGTWIVRAYDWGDRTLEAPIALTTQDGTIPTDAR